MEEDHMKELIHLPDETTFQIICTHLTNQHMLLHDAMLVVETLQKEPDLVTLAEQTLETFRTHMASSIPGKLTQTLTWRALQSWAQATKHNNTSSPSTGINESHIMGKKSRTIPFALCQNNPTYSFSAIHPNNPIDDIDNCPSTQIAVSPDGKRLYAATLRELGAWNAETGEFIAWFDKGDNIEVKQSGCYVNWIEAMCLSLCGKFLMTLGSYTDFKPAFLWDTIQMKLLRKVASPFQYPIFDISMHEGKLLARSNWNVAVFHFGECEWEILPNKMNESIFHLLSDTIKKTGDQRSWPLILCKSDCDNLIIDVVKYSIVCSLKIDGTVEEIMSLRDDNIIASGTLTSSTFREPKYCIILLHIPTGKIVKRIDVKHETNNLHTNGNSLLAISHRVIENTAYGNIKSKISIYSLPDLELFTRLDSHGGPENIIFTCNGDVVSASFYGRVRVWIQ
jgi:hypothetical protein